MRTIIAKSIQGANSSDDGGQNNRALIEALTNSTIYRDYERAFSDLTGLPIALQPVETWQLSRHGQRHEDPFHTLMPGKNRTSTACLQVQDQFCQQASNEPQTVTYQSGLDDGAIPVRLSNRLVGYLQISRAFQRKPATITPKEHESAVKLLAIFAQHLSLVSDQVFIQRENPEPPVIAKARAYIQEHLTEELSLHRVAKALNMSSYYFCKMFKKATGINFTDYVTHLRIEKSKTLLLNPNLRISEIAFEAGFQSLTHFNRVFKKILGQSPTDYRAQLLAN